MKKISTVFLLFLFYIPMISSQVVFEENFEGGVLPNGWEVISNASDGGWKIGSPNQLSSSSFAIANNGSSFVAGTNDDQCNCNKSNERLISPPIDLTNQTALVLRFDSYFNGNSYQGDTELGTVLGSLDGVNWDELENIHGHGFWDTHSINISNYAGQDSVYFAFRYDDGGGWLYGFAIDNFIVEVPPSLEVSVVELEKSLYAEIGRSVQIAGTIYNSGSDTITSLGLSYQINNENPITEELDNISIPAFTYYQFEMMQAWEPKNPGFDTLKFKIEKANGSFDEDLSNNSGQYIVEVFDTVKTINKIDTYIGFIPMITEVANASNGLDKPTDLDFFPILGKDEIWIVNQRTENIGGSTTTITDVSTSPSEFLTRVDGNAWHFMSLPTGIVFSPDNYNFGTSPGVKDANHNGGTFTGPTLWSSDPAIYAQPSGGNGSHLDMLHGSPFSMGIAHEVGNVFWVYDNWNKDIARYDFAADHGPGNSNHDDGIIWRYSDIGINGDGDIPSHLVMDKENKWLYFVDNGNDRVMRIDITTGAPSINLPEFNETLANHSQMTDFVIEEIISEGLERPCGIDIIENRLLIGDYATGEIIIYDMDNGFNELGRIATEETGMTGIKVGPDGNIWYVNRINNSLSKIEPGDVTSASNVGIANQVQVFPNPNQGHFEVEVPKTEIGLNIEMEIIDLAGKTIRSERLEGKRFKIDISNVQPGQYLMVLKSKTNTYKKRIIVQ